MSHRNANRSPVRRRVSHLALALSLACGATLTAVAVEAPAYAQKKRGKSAEPQATYSDAFRAAFTPAAKLMEATPRDGAAMRALIPSIVAAASTPDDRLVGGQFIYNTGVTVKDSALQLQGLGMMLESGKVPAANLGEYNFLAGQLAYQAKDYARARTFIQAAVQAGYTEGDPHLLLTETYVQQNDAAGGLNYLGGLIEQQIAAGQTPSREHLRKALATAYTAEMAQPSMRFANLFARYYPAADSWGDAIVVTRQSANLADDEVLDLLRLQRRLKAFRDRTEYLTYIDAADARRLPNEVSQIIQEGVSSGKISATDSFVAEARTLAQGRQAQVRADLASLERDANASGATATTVLAAGNVFMDAGQPAKAEAFFRKAAGMAGGNANLANTRLGIALVEQGKYADAAAAFNKVQGSRAPIAQLWATYAAQQQGGTATAAAG